MRNQSIKVGGELLDLDNSVRIATTFQNGNIGDLSSRNVSYTSEFRAPLTERNRRTLGLANLSSSRSLIPYSRPGAEYVIGSSTVLKGTVELREYTDSFGLAVYDTMGQVFKNMGDKLLSDLDFGDAPITWNAAYIESKRNSFTGFVAPAIQYGQIDEFSLTPAIGDYVLPSIYVKDVVYQMFLEAGVTLAGAFLSDTKFQRLIIPFSRDSFPSTVISKADILPDIKQIDFIKDLAVKFNLKFSENNGVVTIRTMNSVLLNKVEADDWTRKGSGKSVSLKYKFSNFAQKNYFGTSFSMNVPNLNLPLTTTIYPDTLIKFTPDNFPVNDGGNTIYGAAPRLWNAPPANYSIPFDNPNGFRLLLIRNVHTGAPISEPALRYNGTPYTDYLVAFYDNPYPDLDYDSLNWRSIDFTKGMLDIYYKQLDHTLQYCKFDQREYMLDEKDIHDMDLLKLMVDGGEYFLRDAIRNYVPGELVKVDLLKIW